MNKKMVVTEIIAGTGIAISNSESYSSHYFDGETIDFQKNKTCVSVDMYSIQNLIVQYLQTTGKQLVEELLHKQLKENVRFAIISWEDEAGNPEFTCQVYFNDQLIGEKTLEKEKKDKEIKNVSV